MQKVTLICVGKLKEKFYAQATAEYAKRLSRFCKLEIVELPESRLSDSPSPAEISQALTAEAALIEAKLPKGSALVAMCIEGEELSSPQLAEKMRQFARLRRLESDLSHWRQRGAVSCHQGTGGFPALHVSHDFSPSSCPGDAAGADLPGLSDQRRHQIP